MCMEFVCEVSPVKECGYLIIFDHHQKCVVFINVIVVSKFIHVFYFVLLLDVQGFLIGLIHKLIPSPEF